MLINYVVGIHSQYTHISNHNVHFKYFIYCQLYFGKAEKNQSGLFHLNS